MANTGKTIKQFSLATAILPTDGLLIQRGDVYYYVAGVSLTSGAYVEDTYANVATLKSGGNLNRKASYYLTDKFVFVDALEANKAEMKGTFFARNADFQGNGIYSGITIANGFTVNATGTNLGVWTIALAPVSGDVSIWNNTHYLNITGANGGTNPSTDGTNWELVANTDILLANTFGYVYEYDEIKYDFDGDVVLKRSDNRANEVGNASVDTFQWGNDLVSGNIILGNTVYDNQNQTGMDSNKVITYGSDVSYAKKTLNIGDWNMDTTTGVPVTHSLSATEWKTIKNVYVIIRNDTDDLYRALNIGTTSVNSGYYTINATTIDLYRITAGLFDSTAYDSTSYNRGFVTFEYIAD